MPFLQNLQQTPVPRRHFSIDNHLGRYLKALTHLQSLGVFGEFKDYMVKHQLYQAALKMYKYETEKFNEIMMLYAEYLESQSRFQDAGLGMVYSTLHFS